MTANEQSKKFKYVIYRRKAQDYVTFYVFPVDVNYADVPFAEWEELCITWHTAKTRWSARRWARKSIKKLEQQRFGILEAGVLDSAGNVVVQSEHKQS
jgi:hypothetical protein